MDVRVMHMDINQVLKATSFYQPEAVQESKTKKRLDVLRKDPYFCKGQELMFFNLAKGDTKFVMYLVKMRTLFIGIMVRNYIGQTITQYGTS